MISLLVGGGKRLRVLGWTYVVLLLTMIVLKAKNYYLAPIYPMLFASGAVVVENWLAHREWSRDKVWPKAAIATLVAVAGVSVAPGILPILPPEKLVVYQRLLGIAPPKTEVHHSGPLEQRLGDQFGWEELVAEVARIYRSLPPEERARTGIFASNYGEAGAINLFGPAHGLPRAISAHQNYYFWGPQGFDGNTLIRLQWDRESLEKVCRSVEQASEHFHPWGMAEENRPIFICRGLLSPLPKMWPGLKSWN